MKPKVYTMEAVIQSQMEFTAFCWRNLQTNSEYKSLFDEASNKLEGMLYIYAIATDRNKHDIEQLMKKEEEWKAENLMNDTDTIVLELDHVTKEHLEEYRAMKIASLKSSIEFREAHQKIGTESLERELKAYEIMPYQQLIFRCLVESVKRERV